nr:site-specific integrase [uncultured Carboxylicivirga sp.]
MQSYSTFGVQFIVRKSNNKKEKLIYLRITVDGIRTEFSTKLYCPDHLWNKDKSRVKSDREFSATKTNKQLEQIRGKVIAIYQDLQLKNDPITAQLIKNHFLGIKNQGKTLFQLLDYYLSTQKHSLSPYTIRHYKVTQKYLSRFLKESTNQDDCFLHNINFRFLTEFEAFLRSCRPFEKHITNLSHNTVLKHLARLRTIINLAIKLQWMDHYPFKSYRFKYNNTDRGFLTKQELETIENHTFKEAFLILTRDIFIFSCYTGLSYIDIKNLRSDQISIGIDGKYWIITNRQKTKNKVQIPLLAVADSILSNYSNHHKVVNTGLALPVISNQKLNKNLKRLAELCDINKNITFHVARHTFATTVTLANNVPIETVSKLLGHQNLKTTQIYARVIEQKVSTDMLQLEQKLQSTSNLISINKKTI